MSQYVYVLDTSDYRESDRITKKDLLWHLAETMRIAGSYTTQEQFDQMWDTPAKIERGYVGWPWEASIQHPFFGTIGVADEEDLGKVAAVMKLVLRVDRDELYKPSFDTSWPEPLRLADGQVGVVL